MTARLRIASAVALLLLLALPAVVLAHPLGNFTVNHYAGLRVAPSDVRIDAVVDRAEIPTFEARQDLDTNGDGDVSDEESDAGRRTGCESVAASLRLTVDGAPVSLGVTASGLSFPMGAGGLPTMRLVCEVRAVLSRPITGASVIAFSDRGDPERVGWREVTVVGDGITIEGDVLAASVSGRLTNYPTSLLQQPLDVRTVVFTARPGGAPAPPFVAPDAQPLADPAAAPAGPLEGPSAAPSAALAGAGPSSLAGVGVPGGIGTEIDGLLRARDLTPLVLIASVLAAIALGAGHAITPGHGKTLMGAYLIGARGTPAHAIGLGLAVAASHTAGIIVLALVVLGAGAALPPERFQQVSAIGSAVALTAVGGWLLAGQALAAFRRHRPDRPRSREHDHGPERGHGHAHGHLHGTGPGQHTHAPAREGRLTWRSLALVGFAGGLVPSVNALLILLATIATDRVAFGLVLVAAFGLGMAVVMAGVGLALIGARDRLLARPRLPGLARLAELAPIGGAAFALALGLLLTSQAVGTVRL